MSGSGLIPRCPPAYLETYELELAREAAERFDAAYSLVEPQPAPSDPDDDSAFLAEHLS